jgi:hypothetical protein
MKTIKSKFSNFRQWLLRKKAIRGLRKQNRYAVEVEKVMEQYATHQILNGPDANSRNNSRNVLLKHQQVINVKTDFQDFLEHLK